jgi:hypothetical protein
MSESEKLLSKKGTKKDHIKKQNKLYENQDNYGTLTKKYIVQDEYPRLFFDFFIFFNLFKFISIIIFIKKILFQFLIGF